ncbi:MAG: nucleoside/nucleotide kinase family protein [Beutenbergiaceae bacterium]
MTTIAELAARVAALAEGRQRVIVGVVGAPGSGKSTLVRALIPVLADAGLSAVNVPMDGFHLAQTELERLGRAERKGALDTFDGEGYVALLRRLRANDDAVVYAPEYRRAGMEESIGSAIAVPHQTPVVLTEGNYLLVDSYPWAGVADLLDETWFVAPDDELRRGRLYQRHVDSGKTPELARRFTDGSDETNAQVVASTQARASLLVQGF